MTAQRVAAFGVGLFGGALLAAAAHRWQGGALVWAADVDAVWLARVPGGVAAESLRHGPFRTGAGRAAGFTRDGIGAALAASNLAARVSPAADPVVVEATLREQCLGDVASILAGHRSAFPFGNGPGAGDALYFRVLAGGRDAVVVSLLIDSPQSRRLGWLLRLDVGLCWADGDWRMRVPLRPMRAQVGTRGYTLLGSTQ